MHSYFSDVKIRMARHIQISEMLKCEWIGVWTNKMKSLKSESSVFWVMKILIIYVERKVCRKVEYSYEAYLHFWLWITLTEEVIVAFFNLLS